MLNRLGISGFCLLALCGCATQSPQVEQPQAPPTYITGNVMPNSGRPELKVMSEREIELTQEKATLQTTLSELTKKYTQEHPRVIPTVDRLLVIEKELESITRQ